MHVFLVEISCVPPALYDLTLILVRKYVHLERLKNFYMKNIWGILLWLPWLPLLAQDFSFQKNQISVGASVENAYLLVSDEYARQFVQSHAVRYYNLHFRFRPSHGDAYDVAFRSPSLEVGMLVGDFRSVRLFREENSSCLSGMGGMFTLYGAFRRDLVSTSRFRLNYVLENGIGWSTRPYDGWQNPDNELIGSPFSIYFGAGVGGAYRIGKRWELSLGVNFRHFSNGTLDRPNKGSNTVGVSLGVSRTLSDPVPSEDPASSFRALSLYSRRVYVDMSVGWMGHTLMDEWFYSLYSPSDDPRHRTKHFRVYSALGVSVSAMYRYALRFASGLGLDYGYLPYVDDVAAYDRTNHTEDRYSRHSLGLSLKHEVFYKRLSLYMGVGYYLYRHTGHLSHEFEKPYYETLGLRCTLPFGGDAFYVGYHVKAHLLRADGMEFNVGIRL